MATRRNYVIDQIDRTDIARRNQAIDPENKAKMQTLKDETARRDRALDQPNAGAGRGGQGGPTAKELADYERKQDAEIYTAEKGKPPQDVDSASAPVKKAKGGMTAKFMSFSKTGKPAGMKKVTKMASGGTASSRADGIATKGKTRGKFV